MLSKVYFGTDGLTSTSANHICNLAKEYYKKFETELDQIKFYSTTVSLIGSKESMTISAGIEKDNLIKVPTIIKEVAECKSLIAWLREAIKAKEQLQTHLTRTTIRQWAAAEKITLPEEPEMSEVLTEEQWYFNLPIEKMNRYLYLNTMCAEIGKYIHENGVLNKEKEDMAKKSNAPYSTCGSGRDMTVTKYQLTCDYKDVESIYFTLQDQHRTFQAQLNSIKFECEEAVQKSQSEANAKYVEECAIYSDIMREYQAQFKQWRLNSSVEIQNLKIIIPDHLIEIYNKIKSLGKK